MSCVKKTQTRHFSPKDTPIWILQMNNIGYVRNSDIEPSSAIVIQRVMYSQTCLSNHLPVLRDHNFRIPMQ